MFYELAKIHEHVEVHGILFSFLCYSATYFLDIFQVASFPFDDHNCPPIHLIPSFCQSASSWLKEDEKNVIAVHCKAGLGRTGLMISCLLLLLKVTQCSPFRQQVEMIYLFHLFLVVFDSYKDLIFHCRCFQVLKNLQVTIIRRGVQMERDLHSQVKLLVYFVPNMSSNEIILETRLTFILPFLEIC